MEMPNELNSGNAPENRVTRKKTCFWRYILLWTFLTSCLPEQLESFCMLHPMNVWYEDWQSYTVKAGLLSSRWTLLFERFWTTDSIVDIAKPCDVWNVMCGIETTREKGQQVVEFKSKQQMTSRMRLIYLMRTILSFEANTVPGRFCARERHQNIVTMSKTGWIFQQKILSNGGKRNILISRQVVRNCLAIQV